MSGPSDKDNFIVATVELLAAWRNFKRGHDIESLRMKCCEVSEEFFRSLDACEVARLSKEEFEDALRADTDGGN